MYEVSFKRWRGSSEGSCLKIGSCFGNESKSQAPGFLDFTTITHISGTVDKQEELERPRFSRFWTFQDAHPSESVGDSLLEPVLQIQGKVKREISSV